MSELIGTTTAAKLIGVAPGTLRRMAIEGRGPVAIRLGPTPQHLLKFRRDDVLAWLQRGCPCREVETDQ